MNENRCVNRCTILGEHLESCRGIAIAHGQIVTCEGCFPQPLEDGLLCWLCAAKVDELWELLPDLIPHLRSIERGAIPDGPQVHTAPGSRVIMPASWQMADQLWFELHALLVAVANEQRAEPPTWVGSTSPWGFSSRDSIDTVQQNVWDATFWLLSRSTIAVGELMPAKRLLQLVRRVQGALQAFPLEERAHMVEHIRCRTCQLVTLEWLPPLAQGEHTRVKCTNRACAAEFDPAVVLLDMRQLREQWERLQAA